MSNDKVKVQLSALIDDELPAAERELLLRRLETDEELRQQLGRYQMIQDAIGKHLPEKVDLDLSARIHAQLDQENTYSEKSGLWHRLYKPLSGVAIAASVAVAAIFGAQTLLINNTTGNGNINASELAAVRHYRVTSGMRWDVRRKDLGNRLNGYLVNHSEMTSSTSLQGMMQYVRIAGYDLQQEDSKQKKPDQDKRQ